MSAQRWTTTVAEALAALDPTVEPEDGYGYYCTRARPGAVVLHGYTTGDIDDAAKAAAVQYAKRYAPALDWDDLADLARDGIVDLLLSQPEDQPWPWRRGALIQAGSDEIGRHVKAGNRHRGSVPVRDYDRPADTDRRHRFAVYWNDWGINSGSRFSDPDGWLLDRLAVRQIVASLDPRLRRFALVVAAGGTFAQAAAAIGLSANSSSRPVGELRRVFEREWLGGTRSRRLRGDASRCRYGHEKRGFDDCPTCHNRSKRKYLRAKRASVRADRDLALEVAP